VSHEKNTFKGVLLMKCQICNKETTVIFKDCDDYRLHVDSDIKFFIHYCSNCDIGYTKPDLSPQELSKFYPDHYLNYQSKKSIAGKYTRYKKEREIKYLLKRVKNDNKSLFEIGCGSGETLYYAKKLGFDIFGSDLDNQSIINAKKYFDLDIVPCPAEDLIFNRKHDIVMMRHSLEHLNDPESVLINIYNNALSSGGLLYVVLPRFDSIDFLFMRKYAVVMDIPRHRVQFSKKAVKLLLEKIGFTLVDEYALEAPSLYWESYLEILHDQRSVLKKILYIIRFPLYVIGFFLTIFKPNCMYLLAKKV
jgi:SAM-dependent methyltransferase